MNLKKIGKAFTSKFVRTGPRLIKKICRAAVSQRLRNTAIDHQVRFISNFIKFLQI